MSIEISDDSVTALDDYARIPIAFEVRSVLHVAIQDGGEVALEERTLATPYTKDYDAREGPSHWPAAFDLSNWGLLFARAEGRRVGGAVVAFNSVEVAMLEGRSDLAVLWDLRVATGMRREGIGSALFQAVEAWAVARGCLRLKIETQNVNVAACRFYERQGCTLGAIRPFAYPELPDEIQLLWYKDLK